MAILEVKSLNKIYTTRFGGNQVEALSNVSFLVSRANILQLWENPVRVKPHF